VNEDENEAEDQEVDMKKGWKMEKIEIKKQFVKSCIASIKE
jgi:hypothetical protein